MTREGEIEAWRDHFPSKPCMLFLVRGTWKGMAVVEERLMVHQVK
jgi:hypothetical protein